MNIVDGEQRSTLNFSSFNEVPQISAAIIAAGIAIAIRIERSEIPGIGGVAHNEFASARERRTHTRCAGLQHTIKHIHAALHPSKSNPACPLP